jgi:clan AA aspartic protease
MSGIGRPYLLELDERMVSAVSSVVEPKRGARVGRVVVDVIITNVDDVRRAERGEIADSQIRRTTVPALVDSGATFFCLPHSVVEQLGLPFNRERETRTVSGLMTLNVHGGARVEVMGRMCDVEVLALPHTPQALLGQLPLEALDFWVDLTNQRLVGNPEHGGQWMAEAF